MFGVSGIPILESLELSIKIFIRVSTSCFLLQLLHFFPFNFLFELSISTRFSGPISYFRTCPIHLLYVIYKLLLLFSLYEVFIWISLSHCPNPRFIIQPQSVHLLGLKLNYNPYTSKYVS